MTFAPLLARLSDLSGLAKVGLVVCGYVVALVLAALVLTVYASITSGPDRVASSGMYAFADGLLFVFVFAFAAVPPTGLALHLLRHFNRLWWVFSSTGLAISLTGLLAIANIPEPTTAPGAWSALAVPRMFLAPLLAGLFALIGLFAPSRMHQRWLFAAAGLESLTWAYGFVLWFLPLLLSAGS
jgi:hypothetical protein